MGIMIASGSRTISCKCVIFDVIPLAELFATRSAECKMQRDV